MSDELDMYFLRALGELRRCLGLLLLVAALGCPSFAQTTKLLFDDTNVQEVYLTVDPSDWKTLRDNYLEDTYYPAKFTWRDQNIANVGIRSRGSGSRSPEKPNLLVAFNKYESARRMDGLPQVILKANNQDASLMRELIAMRMFRRMGLPAPREAPAKLYINGEFFGAYTLVEVLDEAFLRRNFGEDTGYLYDWNTRDSGYHFEYLGDDPGLYCPALWSPKTRKKEPDAQTIKSMVQTVNQSADVDFVAAVSKYLDLRLFMRFIAVQNLLADSDGFLGNSFGINNIYTYRFSGSTLYQLLPWDADNTFGWERHPIFEGIDANVLARRSMQDPGLKSTYLEALVTAATLAGGAGGWMDGLIDRYAGMITEMARTDPHKQCSISGVLSACGAADFDASLGKLRQIVRQRTAFVLGETDLAGYKPLQGGPKIEGVSNTLYPNLKPVAGSLVNVFGTGLAQEEIKGQAIPGPTKLGKVMVTFDGVRAPLVLASPTLVVAQAPWDLPDGPVDVTVFVDGVPSNIFTSDLADHAPGILTVTHEADGEGVSAERPARPGERLVVYVSGLGPVNQFADGKPTFDLPAVTVGESEAVVLASGLCPEMPWLYEVVVELKPETRAGQSVELLMTIDGHRSTISIAVT